MRVYKSVTINAMKYERTSIFTILLLAGFSFAALPLATVSARPHVDVSTSVGFGLPHGAVSISVGSHPYHFHRGVYYRRSHHGHGYFVTRAPIGAVISNLPRGWVRIDYRGRPYYRCDDVYYRPYRRGYIVVEPPAYVRHSSPEETTPRPDPYASYSAVWINQRELYIKNGQFFKKTPQGLAWVEAPMGGLSAQLPKGSVSVWYQEEEYFENEGAYFRNTPSGYKLVVSPWDEAD